MYLPEDRPRPWNFSLLKPQKRPLILWKALQSGRALFRWEDYYIVISHSKPFVWTSHFRVCTKFRQKSRKQRSLWNEPGSTWTPTIALSGNFLSRKEQNKNVRYSSSSNSPYSVNVVCTCSPTSIIAEWFRQMSENLAARRTHTPVWNERNKMEDTQMKHAEQWDRQWLEVRKKKSGKRKKT